VLGRAGNHSGAEGFEGVAGRAGGKGLQQGAGLFGPPPDLLPGLVNAAVSAEQLQYLGQGACQALEDAVALGEAASGYPHCLERALKQYEEQRISRASLCQTVARPWGDLWHTRDPTLLALRNRVFRLRRPDDYTDLDWLYADLIEDAA
jgi:hypothetical protein